MTFNLPSQLICIRISVLVGFVFISNLINVFTEFQVDGLQGVHVGVVLPLHPLYGRPRVVLPDPPGGGGERLRCWSLDRLK